MIDRPSASGERIDDDEAPELHNSEQDDEATRRRLDAILLPDMPPNDHLPEHAPMRREPVLVIEIHIHRLHPRG